MSEASGERFKMEERQNTSSSYVFRPILEPPPDQQQQHQQQIQMGGHTFSSDRLSVNACTAGGARKRVNSGGPSSPFTSLDMTAQRAPKLYACWRAAGGSQDAAWSSQGSRHSSRPGSTTGSRPSSQCCNVRLIKSSFDEDVAAAAGASGMANPPSNLLYSRSNNSSTSDVSVSKNFQQLTVSTRRAAWRTQKWSHSLDQPCVSSAQTSPGRRRQTSLQQKSLDLDSGYLGSSTGDLKSTASYSQSSWNNEAAVNLDVARPTPKLHSCWRAGGGSQDAPGAGGGVCSPISDARQELKELTAAISPATAPSSNDELINRSASMPTFCDPPHQKQQPGLRQQMLEASHHLSVLESVTNLDLADDLDEEIKMIVAQGDGMSAAASGGRDRAEQRRSPFFRPPDMQEVLSLLNNEATAADSAGPDGSGGAKYENDGDNSGDIVLIVPQHVRRPEPPTGEPDGSAAAKRRDFYADHALSGGGGGSTDVVLGSGQQEQQEEERDLLLAKPEPDEGGGGGHCGAAGTAPPPPSQPPPTTSRRNRLVRSHRIAEVKEEKDDYHTLAPPKLGK